MTDRLIVYLGQKDTITFRRLGPNLLRRTIVAPDHIIITDGSKNTAVEVPNNVYTVDS